MSQILRTVGEYRGPITDYALYQKTDKGKMAGLSLMLKIQANEVWMIPDGGSDPAWLDCSSWDSHGEGYLVVVTKTGKVNDTQVQRLLKHAGWDGDFESIVNHTWEPTPVRFDIAEDNYQGKIDYRINWINDFASDPGGGGNVDPEVAKTLNSTFGPAIRALRGNASTSPAPTTGKPAAPLPRGGKARRQADAAATPPAGHETPPNEIPF